MKYAKNKNILLLGIAVFVVIVAAIFVGNILITNSTDTHTLSPCPSERTTMSGSCLPPSECVGPAGGVVTCKSGR